jgi:hypothetical protein
MRTTSGRSRRTTATAVSPDSAVPTTVISGIRGEPGREAGADEVLVVNHYNGSSGSIRGHRQAGGHQESTPGRGPRGQAATQGFGTFPHPVMP